VYDLWGACHGYRWPLPAFKTSGAFFPSGERSRRTTNQIHTHMNFWCVVFVIEKSNRTRKNGKAKKEKPN